MNTLQELAELCAAILATGRPVPTTKELMDRNMGLRGYLQECLAVDELERMWKME